MQGKSQSNSINATELPPECLARANIYRLLARLLIATPTADTLETLKALDLVQPVEDNNDIYIAWEALQAAANGVLLSDLDDEFHELFIGISRGELMPYASWYLTGFLMEKPLAELRADLKILGIEQLKSVTEPEDHVAALCEAMALLVEDGDMYFPQQQLFFSKHIQPWMGQFFVDLQTAHAARFYCAVGRWGEQFLAIEKKYLAMPV